MSVRGWTARSGSAVAMCSLRSIDAGMLPQPLSEEEVLEAGKAARHRFAPLVLGMSVSMLGPLSELSGAGTSGDTGTVLSVYLVELCGLIAVLTSDLSGRHGAREVVWRFSTMVPVSLVVFTVCSGFGL